MLVIMCLVHIMPYWINFVNFFRHKNNRLDGYSIWYFIYTRIKLKYPKYLMDMGMNMEVNLKTDGYVCGYEDDL